MCKVNIISLCLILCIYSTTAALHQQRQYVKGENGDTMLPPNKCEAITVPFCREMPYNLTVMPNSLGHTSQEDAIEVDQYFPLVKINCSPDLQLFLCTVYVPICTVLDKPVPPCRSLCLSAKEGCEKVMNRFGFNWPESLSCEQYQNNSALCIEKNLIAPAPPKKEKTITINIS